MSEAAGAPDGDADAAGQRPGDTVQSLVRGLAVIRAFDAEHVTLTLSEVARRAGITRAAAGRFLRTLEELGYLRVTAGPAAGVGSRFALTPRVLELGFSYLSALSIPEIAQPHLEQLSRDIDESVSAAVLDDSDIVYVARVPARRIMSVRITIGTRFPAFATSMGRVLLAGAPDGAIDTMLSASVRRAFTERTVTEPESLRAEIARVRAQGWAYVDGELEAGVRSVAVPLHDRRGTVVAAVNVSTGTFPERAADVVAEYLPPLRRTAERIDAELRLL